MIEGYIMAMFNVGMDLDEVSSKLVLTFNLTQQRAEGFLKEFYEKRNITFEPICQEGERVEVDLFGTLSLLQEGLSD